jgi:hypothetical protein
MKRSYIRVAYVALSHYGKPIASAHTQKDLKVGLDEYYGIGKDSKAKYLDWTPYISKYPDDFEGTYRYEVDDFNGGLELEEVKVYCIDFYPETKYEVKDDHDDTIALAKELQKRTLIDMMEQDEKLGLYKTRNLHMIDEQEIKQYEYASELSKYDSKEDRQQIIERIEVLIRCRGAMAQQILIHKDDAGLLKAMKHLYTHYNNLIKENLGV